MPTVSVIIPTHNRPAMLSNTLDSVLGQTYADFEVIVIDDGSSDHTRAVVAQYTDSRVRYIYQERRGRAEARNTGIRASLGSYVAFLDDDDVWYPRKLTLQLDVFGRDPGVDVVYGRAFLVDQGVRRLLSAEPPRGGSLLEHLVSSRWIIPAGASVIMIRRATLERTGLFDRAVEPFEDWELWMRVAAHGARFAQVNEPVAEYRMHQTNSLRDREYMLAGHLAALNKVLASPAIPAFIKRRRRRYLSQAWLFAGNERYIDAEVRGALEAWCRAIKLDPFALTPRLVFLMAKSLLGARLLSWGRTAHRRLQRLHS